MQLIFLGHAVKQKQTIYAHKQSGPILNNGLKRVNNVRAQPISLILNSGLLRVNTECPQLIGPILNSGLIDPDG